MKNSKDRSFFKSQMAGIIFLCWLIPIILTLSLMVWHITDNVGLRAKQELSEELQINLKMCAARLNSAVEASRLASYDGTIQEAWDDYQKGRNYSLLYQRTRSFLTLQYGSDSRFLFSVFGFEEEPNTMRVTALTGIAGTAYQRVSGMFEEDFHEIREFAEGLDTSVGFWQKGDRIYLVRNVMGRDFCPIGILVHALNYSYYFEELFVPDWAEAMEVSPGDNVTVAMKGEISRAAGDVLSEHVQGSGYTLSGRAAIDYRVLLEPLYFYRYFLLGMAALLVPLLLFTFRFLNRKITRPVERLMSAALQIEEGNIGYQIEEQCSSRELQYLTDSFNQMSKRLKSQIVKLYQEEIALRDAHIKALQAHINPHFLNNTLEIINWEARMNGDAKVSKMIEALSTVLDAALDRKRAATVSFAEEMTYVNAYLYIVRERFGKRLDISVDFPDELMNYRVPRLILQPVIENAVEHGIGAGGSGRIGLGGYVKDGFLILEVENNGGLTEEDEERIGMLLSPDYDISKENSGNIGIANVNTRLRMMYGDASGLSIFRTEGDQVTARLKIACECQNN